LQNQKISSPQKLKTYNQQNVLNIIFTDGPISRVDIASKTGLTQQTITNIVGRLLKENLVVEGITKTAGAGRNPIPLQINYDGIYAIGIEITVKYIRGVIINFNRKIEAEKTIDVKHFTSSKHTVSILTEVIDWLLKQKVSTDLIKGIGISIQGIVDKNSGTVIKASSLYLENYHLKKEIERHFSLPVHLENDVNIIAVVENMVGLLSSSQNNIVLKMDQGIGGAIVINKQLYTGNQNIAGEFGHYKCCYGKDALPCHCGGKGCITTIASIGSLERNLGLHFDEIINRFVSHDPEIRSVMEKIGKFIARGLCNIITFLQPDHVLLTGELFEKAGQFFLSLIQENIDQLVPLHNQNVTLLQKVDNSDGALMAASLVINEMFQLRNSL
jgi:predicted NBD/HSP70 family sugar kinase